MGMWEFLPYGLLAACIVAQTTAIIRLRTRIKNLEVVVAYQVRCFGDNGRPMAERRSS